MFCWSQIYNQYSGCASDFNNGRPGYKWRAYHPQRNNYFRKKQGLCQWHSSKSRYSSETFGTSDWSSPTMGQSWYSQRILPDGNAGCLCRQWIIGKNYKTWFQNWKTENKNLTDLIQKQSASERENEFNQFLIDELEKLDPVKGEQATLKRTWISLQMPKT